MDLIDQLRAFVATAQTGSFTAAAEQMGISNRLTSKYVAELETRLGTRLLQRTTRKVGLTPSGQDLLARAPALLDDLDDVLSEVSDGVSGFSGVIRIAAPVTFGEIYVAGMLGRFADKHPNLSLDLRLNDQFSDLAAEGIDVAFRLGTTDTLSIKSRKLGTFRAILAASPDYLARAGTPQTPEDLQRHACIVDTNRKNPKRWVLQKDGADHVALVTGQHQVNSARAASALAVAGHGIIYAPSFAIAPELEAGRLTPVLPDFATAQSPVTAVYLEGRVLPRKVRALIDFAAQDIRDAEICS
ncbi:LysR family transcriptional regulator [Pseudoprimorskyibacter insulae]|uniref:HTH-type transcriptional regulator DmlR n=1 Tax=Pseudoprimorskyibacter insulae TaxID=1695997 RepID=A0A2R8APS5_9RHOB|nr:LysR family transcriptional regulator [Pseudoprimorskyibacter insulae]SPF77980.1 HTH-type transcriptional regulator DmlR [Pseudoprimorskyibacter insulae]